MRASFAMAKGLGAPHFIPNSAVKKKNGDLTQSSDEAISRWEEHYAEVYRGTGVTEADLLAKNASHPVQMDAGPRATQTAFAKLGRNKGIGPDGIPAELLQAGGAAAAVKYSELNVRIASTHTWPVAWKGGELVNVWKGKKDAADCDASRGILLADHADKRGELTHQ